MKSLPKILLLLLCLLQSVAMWAQSGSVKGQAMHHGMPLDFITIKLCDAEGKVINATLSDEQGTFEFKQLVPGSYRLIGEYQGFTLQNRIILGTDEQMVVTLTTSIFRLIPQTQPARATEPEVIITHCDFGNGIPKEDPMFTRHAKAWASNYAGNQYLGAWSELPKLRQQDMQHDALLIDGVRQQQTFQFSWRTVEALDRYVGGVPAEYGDFTGSILVIETWRM